MRFFRPLLLAGALLSFAIVAVAPPGQGAAQDRAAPRSPAEACLQFASGLSLGAPLAVTKAKLRAGGTLRIVALGSSSTTGFGAFGKGTAFPDVMKEELLRFHPGVTIELINSGRIMEDLGDNISRINDDVLRYKPDLLIWQIGTNDVVWRGIADNAKEMLADAVKRIKAAKTDVVLLDLQYAPLVTLTSRYERMERIIADVAAEQRVRPLPALSPDEAGDRRGRHRPRLVGPSPQFGRRLRVRRRRARPHDRCRSPAIVRGQRGFLPESSTSFSAIRFNSSDQAFYWSVLIGIESVPVADHQNESKSSSKRERFFSVR